MRFGLLYALVLLLTGCTWMLPGDYDIIEAHPKVLKAYRQASNQSMGSAEDLEEIKDAISVEIKHVYGFNVGKTTVTEIHWVSPQKVVTRTREKGAESAKSDAVYCVVQKQDGDWSCSEAYYSPGLG